VTATIDDPIKALLDEAGRWLGTRESEGDENRGVAVDFFNYQTLLGQSQNHWRPFPNGVMGAPWCASFVSTIGRMALGHAWPVAQEVSVSRMVTWAESASVFHRSSVTAPAQGDLFVLFYETLNRWGHVGLVSGANADTIATIEGNTGPAGSREGFGVFARERALDDRTAFIRWVDALPVDRSAGPES
jgi:hypothetical protein